jgi:hypothetical protein
MATGTVGRGQRRVDIDEDGSRDVSGVVCVAACSRFSEHPADVEDPEMRLAKTPSESLR